MPTVDAPPPEARFRPPAARPPASAAAVSVIPRRRRFHGFIAVFTVLGVLTLLLAGTAYVLITKTLDDAADSTAGGAAATETGQDATPTDPAAVGEAPQTDATSSGPPAVQGPASVVSRHFTLLADGDYAGAFELFTPAYRDAEPNWVSARESGNPAFSQIVVGRAGSAGSGVAQVPVSFYARDLNDTPGSDTRCRMFTGTVVVRKLAGGWRYSPEKRLTATEVEGSNPSCP